MAKSKRATNGTPAASTNGHAAQPSRFKRIVAEENRRDPAAGVEGAAPNFNRQMLPHIMTFMSQSSTWNQIYRSPDEALRHSRDNARHMRNDPSIMECLEARQRATALLGWHLEPEDSKCPKQKQLVTDLTGIIERTPDFTEYRRNLLEALWYGRYACQQVWGHTFVRGVRSVAVTDWTPVLGDKLVFRFDTGNGKYSRHDVGIRVGGYHSKRDAVAGDRKLEATEWGMAYFLEDWERPMLAVHKHIIEDGAYEDALSAGRIHGVGIRDRIYWCWFQKQETMAHLMEVIERTGTGFTIYYYQYGNDESFNKMKEVAEQQTKNNVILIPRMSGDPAMDAHGIDRIEPSAVGIDALKSIIHEFFGHQIKRYILGQILSSESAATGLGSGVADLHQDTFSGIIQYDAVKLEETLTHQLVRPVINFNPRFSWARNIYIRFKIDTKSVDAEEKLMAFKTAWDMGAKIKTEALMEAVGSSIPDDGEEFLQNPSMAQQQMGMPGMGGMPGAMPGEQGLPPEEGSDEDLFGPIMEAIGGDESQGGDDSGDGPPPGGPGGGRGAPPGPTGGAARYSRLRDEVQRAAEETDSNPSAEQKEAGNYRKGKVTIHGLPITIENAKGTVRKEGWKPLHCHYGYINRTEGRDGDHVDVFIGPKPELEMVFVVDQCREDGSFDEHKCVLGVGSKAAAEEAYLANYPDGWECGPITAMTIGSFKNWLATGDTTSPVEYQVSKYAARKPLRSSPGQKSLIDRETTTGDHSRWREELHPRESGGKFTSKGHAVVPSSPGQKTLDLSEVDQHKSEIEVHKADVVDWQAAHESMAESKASRDKIDAEMSRTPEEARKIVRDNQQAGKEPKEKAEPAKDDPENARASSWKKNGDGTYTAPNGTIWKKAAAGGEVSPVTGARFEGGRLMPIHGLSVKQPKGDGKGVLPTPPKPKEDGKKKESRPVRQLSAEDIEAEKLRRENGKKWSEMNAGPLGKLKWMGDSPNAKAIGNHVTNIDRWREYAESIGPDGVKELVGKLEKLAHERIDKATAGRTDDAADYEKKQIKEQAEYSLGLIPRKNGAHEKKAPGSLYARELLQTLFDKQAYPSDHGNSVDHLYELHSILSGVGKAK